MTDLLAVLTVHVQRHSLGDDDSFKHIFKVERPPQSGDQAGAIDVPCLFERASAGYAYLEPLDGPAPVVQAKDIVDTYIPESDTIERIEVRRENVSADE